MTETNSHELSWEELHPTDYLSFDHAAAARLRERIDTRMSEIESAEAFTSRIFAGCECWLSAVPAIEQRDAAVRKQALLDAAEIAGRHVVTRGSITTTQRHANMAALEIACDLRALIREDAKDE